jgi:hypothetical protein
MEERHPVAEAGDELDAYWPGSGSFDTVTCSPRHRTTALP